MHITAIETRPLIPPTDDLLAVIQESVSRIPERSILAVSSKAVSIWQGRCVPIDRSQNTLAQKRTLAKKEAEYFHEPDAHYLHGRLFTLVEGVLASHAGIDESNANGHFVLLPRDANSAAEQMRVFVCDLFGRTDVGVLIVDSRPQPLRNGAIGIALGYAGFLPLADYRNTKDIFGRKMKSERLSIVDTLASAATVTMGEGNECTPLVCITELPNVTFTNKRPIDPLLVPLVTPEKDVFAEFFRYHEWERGSNT